eukprot:scaffold658001_cov70-Prasinocladus_malaysianus.AAC.1
MDMRFSLPTVPTLGTMTFLRDACRELQRAGGHLVNTEAMCGCSLSSQSFRAEEWAEEISARGC